MLVSNFCHRMSHQCHMTRLFHRLDGEHTSCHRFRFEHANMTQDVQDSALKRLKRLKRCGAGLPSAIALIELMTTDALAGRWCNSACTAGLGSIGDVSQLAEPSTQLRQTTHGLVINAAPCKTEASGRYMERRYGFICRTQP